MLFTVNKPLLLEALSTIVFASNPKASNPLYSLVRIEAFQGKICLFSHEDEVQMAFTISECEIEHQGHVAVNVKDLLEMVKLFADNKLIKFELNGEAKLKVSQGRAVYKLAITQAAEFPNVPYYAPEQYVPIEPLQLLEAIRKVSHAKSTDDSGVRHYLTGINFSKADEGTMRIAACDGHQLAVIKIPGVIGETFTLAAKAVKILERMLVTTKELGLLVNGSQAFFCFDKGILNTRLLAGTYPNYGKVFPTGEHSLVILNRQATIEMIRRLMAVASKNDNQCISLDSQEPEVIFSAKNRNSDASESLELLPGSNLRSPLAIAFNGLYFLHALEKYSGEEVSIRIYGPLLPILFPNDNFSQVIMPIKR